MICPKCGKQLPDFAKFCDGCGTQVPAQPAQEAAPSETKPEHTEGAAKRSRFFKNKFNAFAVVLTAAAAVVLIVLVAVRAADKEPVSTEPEIDYSVFPEMDKSVKDAKQFLSAQSWEDMEFLLNGVQYKLPLDIAELEANGWTLDYDDKEVEPRGSVRFTAWDEQSVISGELFNFGDSSAKSKDCMIQEIQFTWANPVFPGDIQMFSTTIDAVYEVYGTPDLFNDYDSKEYFWGDTNTLSGGDGGYIQLVFDDQVITYAELACNKETGGD